MRGRNEGEKREGEEKKELLSVQYLTMNKALFVMDRLQTIVLLVTPLGVIKTVTEHPIPILLCVLCTVNMTHEYEIQCS